MSKDVSILYEDCCQIKTMISLRIVFNCDFNKKIEILQEITISITAVIKYSINYYLLLI